MKGIPVNSGDAFFFFDYVNFILCNIKQIVVFVATNIIILVFPRKSRTGHPVS